MSRKKYIVIHGHSASLLDTVLLLETLSSFESFWYNQYFYIPRKAELAVRQLLSAEHSKSRLFSALQKIIVSRMLQSCDSPHPITNPEAYISLGELSLMDELPELAIPFGPESRKYRAQELNSEGISELLSIFKSSKHSFDSISSLVSYISSSMLKKTGEMYSEKESMKRLEEICDDSEVLQDFSALRDINIGGSDLDTLSSAVFYAHVLSFGNTKENIYGKDYQFVFMRYHEGLKHWTSLLEPGDIYMADIPISTIPDLRSDLISLKKTGFTLKRYEDHHPYTKEQLTELVKLKKEGLLEYFAMSGPEQGKELSENEMKCGADMVFESLIKKSEFNTEAIEFLQVCTHGEDLARDRKPTGKLLTELIKGGINQIELAQKLLLCKKKKDIYSLLESEGWQKQVIEERKKVADISDKFLHNIQLLEADRPSTDAGMLSGAPYCEGSDMPIQNYELQKNGKLKVEDGELNTNKKQKLNILICLAPRTAKNEPKLNIGRACEYFGRNMPEIDYLLYCYGSSLIVSRRLNQADSCINLSDLMRNIGTDEDGGHAGAAVCCPENNKNYPHTLLGSVDSGNFSRYCRYLTEKIEGIVYKGDKNTPDQSTESVFLRKNLSKIQPSENITKGGIRLFILIVVALLIGLGVILFLGEYRFQKVKESNKDFFPWIKDVGLDKRTGKQQNNGNQ
ncbi:MAG: hypothetical protein U9O87_06230 [Verrucomicrobiota bacterium]|nr:hypothetical protein [Verrucomicrobiota bacterium]